MMGKFGIGIDIVKINRFRKMPYPKNKKFYNKIFLLKEIQYCLKYRDSAVHFAGKFALKEATKKSINKHLDLLEIETSHSNSAPIVRLLNNNNYTFMASLSHEDIYAIAVVISAESN